MSHFTCLNSVCVIFWVDCVNGTTFFVVLNIYNLLYCPLSKFCVAV